MCGFYGHGFYWKGEKIELKESKDFIVVFDFEINSHSKIREYRKVPNGAIRIGFDPINGEAVQNDNLPLPIAVKEKVNLLFQMYFPDRKSISEWIRKNYAKNDDKREWDYRLLLMLKDRGEGLFSKQYYTQRAQDCTQRAQDCTGKLITMDIDKFIEYFSKNPNNYWKDRIVERVTRYEQFVKI